MPQSSATRQRPGNRVKRKDSGPQEVTLSPRDSQDEINGSGSNTVLRVCNVWMHSTHVFVTSVCCISRLRHQIDRLQKDRRLSERETGDDFTLTAELRWKLNQLEKEKLQFTSKYNEEVRYLINLCKTCSILHRIPQCSAHELRVCFRCDKT